MQIRDYVLRRLMVLPLLIVGVSIIVFALTRIGGSNLGNDKTYDQIAFAPTALRARVENYGVFDFDGAVFASKWKSLGKTRTHAETVREFNKYLRHYLSDHRPVWVEIKTN